MSWIGVITDAGAALLAQWSQGSETLIIDGATVGSGTTAEANMRQATALVTQKDTASIVSAKALDSATQFKVQVGPASAQIGAYVAHEIGIWGHIGSGDPVLIALHQDSESGVQVPLASASPNFAFSIYLTHAISNDGTLAVNIDTSAYVSFSTMEEHFEEKFEEIFDEVGSTMREVPFSIAVADWELTSGVYQATFLSDYATDSCKFEVFYDSTIRTAARADINAEVISGGGGIVFTTSAAPIGILSGKLWIFAPVDGKIPVMIEDTVVPVANGGTGKSSVDGIKQLLGIDIIALTNTQKLLTVAVDPDLCPAESVRWFNVRRADTSDLPDASLKYSMARVLKRLNNTAFVEIYCEDNKKYYNVNNGEGWLGWKCQDDQIEGIEIPENADLDTLKTPGNYYSPNSTRTGTLSHVPSGVTAAFSLNVFKKGSLVNQSLQYTTRTFTRGEGNNGFSDWAELALNATIGSANNPVTDLGTIPLNSIGNVVFAAAISPCGVVRSHSYWKSGLDANRYVIYAVDQYDKLPYFQVNYDGTLSGWKSINTQDYCKIVSLGDFSTIEGLNTKLSNKVTSMQSYSACNIRVHATANADPYINGSTYQGTLFKFGSDNYANVLLFRGASSRPITVAKSGDNWYHYGIPNNYDIDQLNMASHSSDTLENIQTWLVAQNGELANGKYKNIGFVVSTAAMPFGATAYYGYMMRRSATLFSVLVQSVNGGSTVISGGYSSGTWSWTKLAPGSNDIPSNTDLNDLDKVGFYSCGSSTVAATLANSPVSVTGFSMQVQRKGDLRTQFINTGGAIYIRTSTSSGWGSWNKLQIDYGTTNVSPGASLTFTLANYGRCLLTAIGYSDADTGMWILRRSGTSLIKKAIADATSIAISMDSSGVVTVTNNSSYTVTFSIDMRSNVTI